MRTGWSFQHSCENSSSHLAAEEEKNIMTFGLFRRIIISSSDVYTRSFGWFPRRRCPYYCPPLTHIVMHSDDLKWSEDWSCDQSHMNLWPTKGGCVCVCNSLIWLFWVTLCVFLPVWDTLVPYYRAVYNMCYVHVHVYVIRVSDVLYPQACSCTDAPQRQRERGTHG